MGLSPPTTLSPTRTSRVLCRLVVCWYTACPRPKTTAPAGSAATAPAGPLILVATRLMRQPPIDGPDRGLHSFRFTPATQPPECFSGVFPSDSPTRHLPHRPEVASRTIG